MKKKSVKSLQSDIRKLRKYARAVAVIAPVILTGGIGAVQTAQAASLTWNNAGGNSLWDTVTANWTTGSANSAYTDGSTLTFALQIGGNISISNAGAGVTPASITISGGGNWTFSSTTSDGIKGSGGITDAGTGILTLSTANSFTGGVNMTAAGTLAIGSSTALGTGTLSINAAGATLMAVTSAQSISNAIAANQNFIIAGTQALTFTGTTTLGSAANTINSTNTALTTFGTISSTNTGLTLTGSGSVNTGALNLGTAGLTIANTGVVTVTAASNYGGATTINTGTLKLDFSAGTAAATNLIKNTSPLVMSSGTLILNGKASTTNSQQFASLTLNGGSSIQLTANATSNPLLLSLGAITRNVGGTVDFTQPTGTISATNGITTSTANTASTILGGWATVGGTNWAVNNGTNIVALSTYTTTTTAGNTAASYNGNNIDITSAQAPSGAITPNSLRFNTAAAETLTLTGTNIVTSGGILNTTTVGTNGSLITGGTLEGAAGQDLVVIQNNTQNFLTIASTIADNTTATALTKSGLGTLILTGTNTYTGKTLLNNGTLNFASGSLGTGQVTFNGTSALQWANGNTQDISSPGIVTNVGIGTLDTLSNNVSLAGVISNAGGIGKAGLGTLTLNGTNTFTGGLTITAGTVAIGNNSALGTGLLTLNGLTDAVQGSGAARTLNNAIFANQNFAITGNQALTFSGAMSLGNAVTIANSNTATTTFSGPISMIQNLTLTGAGNTVFSGIISSGAGVLTLSGTGTETLSGTNTFGGGVTLNSGTLLLGNASALGAGTFTLSGANATIQASGSAQTLAVPITVNQNFNVAGTLGLTFTGTTTLGNSVTITSTNTGLTTFGAITGLNNNLTIAGSGNVTLGGVNTGGTGALTMSGTGILTVNAASSYSGATTINSGTLKLDHSAATAPTNNILNNIAGATLPLSGGTALVLNGGTLSVLGKIGTANTEHLFNTGITGAGSIQLTAGTSGQMLVSLGAITRTVGGTVDFTQPAGTISATNGITTSTGNSLNPDGTPGTILGGWATVGGNTWATNNGTDIVGLTTYTAAGTTNTNYANKDIDVTSSVTIVGGQSTPNSLRFNTNAADTLTFASGTPNFVNTINSGGILVTSTVGALTSTISGGLLAGRANGDLVIIQNNTAGGLTISSTLVDNYLGLSGLTKSGAGLLTLTGANSSYSGGTVLNSGTLSFASGSLGTGSVTINGTSTLQWNGTNTQDITANNRTLTFANGTGTLDIGANNVTLSGILTGSGALTKIGAGTLTLSGALSNTNTGTVTISNGTVVLAKTGGATALNGTVNLGDGSANQPILQMAQASQFGAGAVLNFLNASANTARLQLVGNSQTLLGLNDANGSGMIENGASAVTATSNATLTLNGSGNYVYKGILRDTEGSDSYKLSLVMAGSGTQTLAGANTYTGSTTINSGTVKLDFSASSAPASNIVSSSSALVLSGGTLAVAGGSTAANSQTFNGTTIAPGNSSVQLSTNATAQSLLLNLGALTRSIGGTVDFTQPLGALSASNGIVTSTANTSNGILGGWATVGGSTWAVNNGTDIVGLGTYLTTASAGATATNYLSTSDVDVTNSLSFTGGITVDSLRFNTATTAALTLSSGTTNIISSGGILVTANTGSNTSVIAGGTLEGAAGKDLVFIQNNALGGLTVTSTIADNTMPTALTKAGVGLLTLTASNTYTGGTVLTGGTLSFSNGSLGTGAITINGNATLQWSGSNTQDITASNNLTLGGGIGTLDTQANGITLSGAIVGAGGLTKIGTGNLTLSGRASNTYTGTTTITNGTVFLSKTGGAAALSGTINFGNGTNTFAPTIQTNQSNQFAAGTVVNFLDTAGGPTRLQMVGTSQTLAGINDALGAGIIENQGVGVGTAAGALLTLNGSGNYSFIGSLRDFDNTNSGGTLSLVMAGTGTQTLAGSQIIYSGSTTINGGTLKLDYSQPSSNITNLINNNSALILGGGTLAMVGSGSGNVSQLFSSLTLNAGASAIRVQPDAAGYGVVLNTGALTRNAGSTLDVTRPAGAQSTINQIVAPTFMVGGLPVQNAGMIYTDSNGIAFGTLNGSDWLAVDPNGNGYLVGLSTIQPTTDSFGNPVNYGYVASTLTNLSGNADAAVATTTLASSTTTSITSLRVNQALATTINLGSGSTLQTGGILITPAVGNNLTTITGGSLTSAGTSTTANELVIIQNNTLNGLTISSVITDETVQGTVTPVTLTKAGAGTMTLSSANTYTGGTDISQGTVLLGNSSSALGTGRVTMAGNSAGTSASLLINTGGLTIANPITVANTGTSPVILGTNTLTGSGTFSGAITLAGPVTLQGLASTSTTFSGAIGGTGAVTVSGGKTVILSNANNSFNGGVTVTGSGTILQLGTGTSAEIIPNSSSVTVGTGATLQLKNVAETISGLNGAGIVNAGVSSTLTVGANGGSGTFTGTLSDGGTGIVLSFTKTGSGTQSLSGANTYTGATTINGGVLNLDFTGGGAPAANIIGISSALNIGGGTLVLTGKAGVANSQKFNGTTFAGGASSIQLNANANSNTLGLTLGAITRSAGAAVDFTLPSGTLSATNGVAITGGTAGQILMSSNIPYATVGGSDWAAVDATGSFLVGLSSLNGYTNSTSTTLSGNANVVSGTVTLAGATSITSMRFNAATANQTIALASNTLTVGGILLTPNVGNNAVTISGGTLKAAGAELFIDENDLLSGLTVSANIADNAAATAVTLTGAGSLTLSGTNTYTGGVNLDSGTLGIGSASALGTGGLRIYGGKLQAISAAQVVTNAVAVNGDFTIGGTLGLNFTNTMTVSGNRTITLTNTAALTIGAISGTASSLTLAGTGSATLGGVIALGTGSLTMNSAGTLTLTGANTFSGGMTLNAGTLSINSGSALGTGTFTIGGGTLSASASSTISVPVAMNGDFTITGSQPITFTNKSTLGSSRTITLSSTGATTFGAITGTGDLTFTGSGAATVTGAVTTGTGGLFVNGPGTITLTGTNTYTGNTAVNNSATLQIGNGGAGGSLVSNVFLNTTTASLTFNSTTNQTYAGSITGSGTLNQAGTNTLTLTGNSNFSGPINIKQGAISVNSIYGNFGLGPLGNGQGLLTLGNASPSTAGTLIYTGSSDVVSNLISVVGAGGIIKTDGYLTFTSKLSGTSPLSLDMISYGGGAYFSDASGFTGSINVLNGHLTLEGLAATTSSAPKTVTLPAGGPTSGYLTVNGTSATPSIGTYATPDFRSITVPAAGGTISVDPGGTWYVGSNSGTPALTDSAAVGAQPFNVGDGSNGSVIFVGQVVLNQVPTITSGTLGFGNQSTSTTANQFKFGPNAPIIVNTNATLLTYPNALGSGTTQATFQLNGGTFSVVGSGTSTTFGYNVPVVGDGSALTASNGGTGNFQAFLGTLDMKVTSGGSGSALNLGVTQGRITFTGTNFYSSDTYNFNIQAPTGLPTGDLSLGAVNTGSFFPELQKTGDGNLSFDNATVTNLHINGIDVQQGHLQLTKVSSVTQSLIGTDQTGGSAAISFHDNGAGVTAGLVVSSNSLSGAVNYDNPINVFSNATISAAPITYNSTAQGIGIIPTLTGPITVSTNDGTGARPVLSLSSASASGYTLGVASSILGGGDVSVTSGIVNWTSAGNNVGNLTVTGGTLNYTASSALQSFASSGTSTTNFKQANANTTIANGLNVGGSSIVNVTTANTVMSVNGGANVTGGTLNVTTSSTLNVNGGMTVTGAALNVTNANLSSPGGLNVNQTGVVTFNGANYTGGAIKLDGTSGLTGTLATLNSSGATNLNGATINMASYKNTVINDQLLEGYYSYDGTSNNPLDPTSSLFLPARNPNLSTPGQVLSYLATNTGLNFTGQQMTNRMIPAQATTTNFAGSWIGYFHVSAPGTYSFSTASDDGSAIFVDLTRPNDPNALTDFTNATEVVNSSGAHGVQTVTGSVTFNAAGDYPIYIGYYQQGGGYSMLATYTAPSGSATNILSTSGEGFHTGTTSGGGTVNVNGGSLSAGAITNGLNVNMAVNSALNLTNTTGASDTVLLKYTGASGTGTLNVAGGHTLNVTNLDVTAGGTLALTGAGAVLLKGSSDSGFNGAVTVANGTLNLGTSAVHGAISGSLTAQSGSTITGIGTAGSLIAQSGSYIAPASGVTGGTISATNVTLNAGSALGLTLTSASVYSKLAGTSTVNLTGDVALGISLNYDPADNADSFKFLTTGGSSIGTGLFTWGGSELTNNSIFEVIDGQYAQFFQIQYGTNSVTLLAIPEPNVGATLMAGAGLLLGLHRFRRRALA